MAGEQFCGRGPVGLCGEQAEQEPAMQPGSKVASKVCMDRNTARRVTCETRVTWMCQKEAKTSISTDK